MFLQFLFFFAMPTLTCSQLKSLSNVALGRSSEFANEKRLVTGKQAALAAFWQTY
jgi:hypothetical protein